MSPRTGITTLNLGSQSIELAQFRTQSKDGLILCAYRTRELLVDPGQEMSRHTQVVTALREMLAELQVKPGNVNYSMAEESIFTRFVKLPPIEEEKIERIISFEAQQNVPFPIEELVWDYQLIGRGANEQVQVVLAAIKADLLEETNSAIEETGLRTSIVDLATMALYNAFRHNYDDVSGCSLLVDIGARTTNLLFIESEKFFTRSVPIGGSSVTSAIAKEFTESFVAAEVRKKRDGSVGLDHVGAESNGGDVARVTKIVHTIMTRLHGELMRSINHYCSQQEGQAPGQVFLSGGSASIRGLREFFQQKLRLPLEFFNPLRRVAVADSVTVEEIAASIHLLGEPIGLALRTAIDCPMKLNLRPPSVVRRQEMERRRPFLVAAALCFVLGLLSWGVYFGRAAQILRGRTEKMHERVVALKRVESQFNEVRRQTTALDNLGVPLIEAINDRSFWLQIVEELNARLPKEDIWITDLVATSKGIPCDVSDGRALRAEATPFSAVSTRTGTQAAEPTIDGILLHGLYLFNQKQQEVVVDYFRNLTASPWFAIDQNNQANVIKPTTPNNAEWAFPYELRLDLRKPVRLP